jgi:hypothetical protein
MTLLPNRDTPSVCFVAPDVDTAWREIGEHLLHDARMYAEWNPDNETPWVSPMSAMSMNCVRQRARTGSSPPTRPIVCPRWRDAHPRTALRKEASVAEPAKCDLPNCTRRRRRSMIRQTISP